LQQQNQQIVIVRENLHSKDKIEFRPQPEPSVMCCSLLNNRLESFLYTGSTATRLWSFALSTATLTVRMGPRPRWHSKYPKWAVTSEATWLIDSMLLDTSWHYTLTS